jgi:hypothetical protein
MGHPWPRLSILAFPREGLHDAVRVMRAEEKQINVGPVFSQLGRDVAVHVSRPVQTKAPPSDPGLIGQDRDGKASPIEPGDGLWSALNELDAIDGADVAMINDDRAIPIKKDAGSRSAPVRFEWNA